MPKALLRQPLAIILAAAFVFAIECQSAVAHTGQLYVVLVKKGRILGAYGRGSLFYNARRHLLSITGVDFDSLKEPSLKLEGNASNLTLRTDIIGTYRAAEDASAIIDAKKPVRLKNERNVLIELHCVSPEHCVTFDLTGITVTMAK